MEKKTNCWEYFHCGREPAGKRVNEVGVCPAATETSSEEMNGGKAAGRFCWTIEGTLCPGNFAKKFGTCLQCSFLAKVTKEEGRFFVLKKKSF
jgi:hypothetical protein